MRKAISAGLTALSVVAIGTASLAGAATVSRPAPQILRPNAIKPAATANLVGGGATLPVNAYTGDGTNANGTLLGTGGVKAFDAHSSFGYLGTVSSYCVTGSGKGRAVLENGNTGTCSLLTGFTATAGTPANVDFAASDAPISSTDYSNYLTHHTDTGAGIVQIPAVVGSIAIAVNYSGAPTTITVTKDKIAGVFNHSITTWGGFLGTTDATPIGHVYYRSDSSGTTFSFSNWLEHNSAAVGGNQYNVDSLFTNVIAAFGAVPATFVGAAGNAGVIAALDADTAHNSIGYVEAFYAKGDANVKLTKININGGNQDPIANLPETGNALNFGASDLVTGDGISTYVAGGSPNGGFTPALVPITGAGANVLLVKPTSYSNPSAGYPIVAVSYLDYNATGNGTAKLANVQQLAKSHSNSANYGPLKITTIQLGTSANFKNGTTGFTEPNLGSSTYTTDVTNAANTIVN